MSNKLLDGVRTGEFWAKIKNTFSKKFDIDDTLTMNDDNVLSVKVPNKVVTGEEYNALTEEERSGLYIIKDRNINLKDRGEVYSTEETLIGTWIDGKILYQITIDTTVPSGLPENQWTTIVPPVVNNVKLLHLNAYIVTVDGNTVTPSPVTEESFSFELSYSNLLGLCVYQHGFSNILVGRKIYATIRYTKTTDEAVSE